MNKLYYRTLGEGTPLIILHGLFGSSDNWISLAKFWAENFQVFLIDLRNHGQSFHSSEFNYDVMSQDLLHLMDEEQIESAFIIGHSMGGKVAMKFAIQNPNRVTSLIVIDIGPKFYPVHHEQILKGLTAIPVNILSSRNEAEEILKKYVSETGIRQFLLKNLKRVPDGFDWKINLLSIRENIEKVGEELEATDQFDGPTLFIRGFNSNYIEDADLKLIYMIFPNSKLETIAGAGHWVHAERPKELMNVINGFMQS